MSDAALHLTYRVQIDQAYHVCRMSNQMTSSGTEKLLQLTQSGGGELEAEIFQLGRKQGGI